MDVSKRDREVGGEECGVSGTSRFASLVAFTLPLPLEFRFASEDPEFTSERLWLPVARLSLTLEDPFSDFPLFLVGFSLRSTGAGWAILFGRPKKNSSRPSVLEKRTPSPSPPRRHRPHPHPRLNYKNIPHLAVFNRSKGSTFLSGSFDRSSSCWFRDLIPSGVFGLTLESLMIFDAVIQYTYFPGGTYLFRVLSARLSVCFSSR